MHHHIASTGLSDLVEKVFNQISFIALFHSLRVLPLFMRWVNNTARQLTIGHVLKATANKQPMRVSYIIGRGWQIVEFIL